MHHELRVVLEPAQGTLRARDTVTLPADPPASSSRTIRFLLHAGLAPRVADPGLTLRREEGAPGDFLPEPGGGTAEPPRSVPTEGYALDLPPGAASFTLEYGGPLRHPVEEGGEEYARGFGVTPGLVSAEGVFLSGASVWVPWLGGNLVTFTLGAEVPAGWDTVSQGFRGPSGWESPEPQDEVYLVAAPWTEYRRTAGAVSLGAFLRKPDPALAARYLDATERYLDLYDRLLGPYPYRKFALVENFWETGYGMPSFTLLGPSIIRFPFILNTSYPHEILHNWWGNGVYVDSRGGNWCEGLTAYLADHLLQEQKGEGAEYRLATLQKYADYAARAKDFPLTAFVSRYSAATEAVGYGKALFLFHMLRQELGDDTFRRGLRRFYAENHFRPARYEDLRRALEAESGRDLGADFRQWVERTGAPALRLSHLRVERRADGFVLAALLSQTQDGDAYPLRVPVAVTLEGRADAFQTVVELDRKQAELRLELPARPLRVDVDPEFDVFRRLSPAETPPALSELLGAEKVLIVLPSAAPKALLDAYRALARSWSEAAPEQVEIASDDEVSAPPSGRALWVFGWENRLLPAAREALAPYDCEVGDASVRFERATFARSGHSAVAVGRSPGGAPRALGWLAADSPEALPGLGRKLPHYQKWSYLAFEGPEPANVAKGRWPVVGSPLTADVAAPGSSTARAKLAPRPALIDFLPPPVRAELLESVRFLASDDLKGRGLGTPELGRAAEWLAEQFRAAGLRPGGDGGTSWFQTWTERVDGADVELRNVVGVLPGANPAWAGQSVVLSAHYDGQGLGLPGGRAEDRGKIHPGADDNASGVAALVQVARALGKTTPGRSVVFAAFTGEEEGRLGSRRYVAAGGLLPAAKALGEVNLDTVGRLERRKLLVLGCGSAAEWIHVFNGAGYTAGVDVECVPGDVGGSDQVSFLEAGVPAVQLFSGPHLDYHRPGDTLAKLDADGLVKVAVVAKEAVEYLASRPGPLTAGGGAGVPPSAAPTPPGGRKVSLGIVPDFAFAGEGVRLSGVSPGSPADKAGLREGDVLVRIGGTGVRSLRDLSGALARLQAGDEVEVAYVRDGGARTARARIEER